MVINHVSVRDGMIDPPSSQWIILVLVIGGRDLYNPQTKARTIPGSPKREKNCQLGDYTRTRIIQQT